MAKNFLSLMSAVISSFTSGLPGFNKSTQVPGQSVRVKYSEITPSQAKELLGKQGVIFIDVRERSEYNQGHIPGIKLIPLGQLAAKLAELDKDKEYVMVCRSSGRSALASKLLINNGFTKVSNMIGGMLKWTYKVEK